MKDPLASMADMDLSYVPSVPGASAAQDQSLDQRPDEIVEVPLLLPGWQITALEREAHYRGLTAGEMVRHLLRDFINNTTSAAKARR